MDVINSVSPTVLNTYTVSMLKGLCNEHKVVMTGKPLKKDYIVAIQKRVLGQVILNGLEELRSKTQSRS